MRELCGLKAFDGDLSTYYHSKPKHASDAYVGLEFPLPVLVSGVYYTTLVRLLSHYKL